MRLPDLDTREPTGPVDALADYYRFPIGFVMRRRLEWVLQLLPKGRAHRVLEIGYGSGVFLLELGLHGRRLFGIDIHGRGARVRERLANHGIRALLVRGSGTALPFRGGSIDLAVIVSALEFIPGPAGCLREALRVVGTGGCLICLTPRKVPWADAVYRLLAGRDPEASFRGARAEVFRALREVLPGARRTRRPAWLPRWLAPYELTVFGRGVG